MIARRGGSAITTRLILDFGGRITTATERRDSHAGNSQGHLVEVVFPYGSIIEADTRVCAQIVVGDRKQSSARTIRWLGPTTTTLTVGPQLRHCPISPQGRSASANTR